MDKLEKLFKSSGHGEQPDAATREGFEKMVDALEKPLEKPLENRSDPKKNRRLIVLFFLFGAIAVAGWYTWPSGVPDFSEQETADDRLEIPLRDGTEPSSIVPAKEINGKSNISRSDADPIAVDEQRGGKEQEVGDNKHTVQNGRDNTDSGKRKAVPPKSKAGEDKVEHPVETMVVKETSEVKGGLEDKKPALVYPLKQTTKYALPEKDQVFVNRGLGVSSDGKSAGIHVPDVSDRSWNRSKYELVDKGQAYWTVGGTVLGRRFESNDYVERWETNPVPGNFYEEMVNIDGRETLLYYDDLELRTKKYTDVTGMLQLRRQTSKSLFFGIGLSNLSRKRSSIKFAQELILDNDETYYKAWTSQQNYLIISTTVGITFLRSRRYQPWVGVDANFPFVITTKNGEHFLEGTTGNVYLQSERIRREYRPDIYSKIFPSIQFGVRGQLSQRLRIGITGGILPTNIYFDTSFGGGLDLHYVFGH